MFFFILFGRWKWCGSRFYLYGVIQGARADVLCDNNKKEVKWANEEWIWEGSNKTFKRVFVCADCSNEGKERIFIISAL